MIGINLIVAGVQFPSTGEKKSSDESDPVTNGRVHHYRQIQQFQQHLPFTPTHVMEQCFIGTKLALCPLTSFQLKSRSSSKSCIPSLQV